MISACAGVDLASRAWFSCAHIQMDEKKMNVKIERLRRMEILSVIDFPFSEPTASSCDRQLISDENAGRDAYLEMQYREPMLHSRELSFELTRKVEGHKKIFGS